MKTWLVLALASWLVAAHGADAPGDPVATSDALLRGRFDNRAQSAAEPGVAHTTIEVEPVGRKGWSLWHVRIETDAQTSFEQTWAMQARAEHDGSGALIPYYQLKQDAKPEASAFEPSGWLSLEACALRGTFGKTRIEAMSEGEPCVAVSMGVGARRALLPVGLVREGGMLHVDLNLRGVRTRIDAERMP